MYGPPPDPRQVYAPTGLYTAPGAWALCVLVGVLLAWRAGTKRPLLFIIGVVLALTTPFGAMFQSYVWGQFPTIDKSGSLLFYLDGVHERFWHADDPALRLIGVHVGHLWITAFFDLFFQPFAAMNAQAFMNLVLGWFCAYLLLRELSGNAQASLLLAFPFGMNLHLFRDINWYTIEKSGVFWVPLYAWTLVRTARDRRWIGIAALVYVGTFFCNIYLGVLCAGLGGLALLSRNRNVAFAVIASAVAAVPLVVLQARLLHGEGTLGDPQTFLTQRAALDTLELWPLRWNRLEGWRALNVVALGLAGLGLLRRKNLWLGGIALVFLVLALGPTHNPVYMALFEVIPGFWRIAKPETFFHVTWLALLAIAARRLADADPSARTLRWLAVLFAVGWIVSVRTHPVYPRFTMPVDVELSPKWKH